MKKRFPLTGFGQRPCFYIQLVRPLAASSLRNRSDYLLNDRHNQIFIVKASNLCQNITRVEGRENYPFVED